MSQHGVALQSYNQELAKYLEDLVKKRNELQSLIEKQEDEKSRVQKDIEKLSYKLSQLNESLSQRLAAREDFDRLIAETEAGYVKILESSQVLLSLVKREATCLDQCHVKPSQTSSATMGGSTPSRQASNHNYKFGVKHSLNDI